MKTKCQVCPWQCMLEEGQVGRCHARKAVGGRIISENYGQLTAIALDPIEKKPLRCFYPGSAILSVGSYGCNMHCPFCQNAEISMADHAQSQTTFMSPDQLAGKASLLKNHGNIGVAFTYNEPMIGYEYVRDTAKRVKSLGMKTVVVTNGNVSLETARAVLPYIDAFNIDLKGFTEDYYKWLGGDFETVKAFIIEAAQTAHVELTTLIIPDKNDQPEKMQEMAQWIAAIDENIPLHLSRFFPAFEMQDEQATSVERVYALKDIASEVLKKVFTGNC